jgi:class 3 adenylate cyclase/tetratricopeptide (TPR) repeat protein
VATAALDTSGRVSGHRGSVDPYVPRVLLRHLVETPDARLRTLDATVVLADISGSTRLSERLARIGREGAEELVETMGSCFGSLLAVAYEHGGDLLKFGGDALLVLFEGEGHAARACSSAIGMRRRLREVGRLVTSAGKVTLRMSQGVHSGEFHLFLVGASHRELLIVGQAASTVVAMEKAADAGEVLISATTAARLPDRCTRQRKGPGLLLAAAPPTGRSPIDELDSRPPVAAVAAFLSKAVRAHLASGRQPAEHRTATTAFVRFEGTDALVSRAGPDAAVAPLDKLIAIVQQAVDEQEVCFLESDLGVDGAKLLLTAGAPRVIGDDEERMLLALRRIVEADLPLPVCIGVNRGSVFSGDVGPAYRHSYTVMGDAVNLAARLMAKAPAGEIYATQGVLERSATRFALEALEPFAVKGKARPVEAWSVRRAVGSRARDAGTERLPLIGRERELAVLEDALEQARGGHGGLVEIVGEPGIGKTRLVGELRERAGDLRVLEATCEAYTAATPYAAWRELLRMELGVGWEDPDDVVVARLHCEVEQRAPELLPWLPLLVIPFDADMPPTRELEELSPDFRRYRMHEVVGAFLQTRMDRPALVEIRDAHLMDAASAELLRAVGAEIAAGSWLVVVTRSDLDRGFAAPEAPWVVRLRPEPLGREEALAVAEAFAEIRPLPPHVLQLAAERAGGNPQFLRDLLRAAADGQAELPDSIEAATMARIDRLTPADRSLVRRAAVLGVSFHPRNVAPLLEEGMAVPDARTWQRLGAVFTEEADGYLRFQRAVYREAAYSGLPFRTRRRLHGLVAARLEREAGQDVDDAAAILSLHFLRAARHAQAWRFARIAADRASERYAYADAASLYRRALDAARGLDVPDRDLAEVWASLGLARAHTGELAAATAAFAASRRLVAGDVVADATLLHRHATVDLDAGRVLPAVRWVNRGLRALEGVDGEDAAACRARLMSVLATIRQRQGRMEEAISLCHRAIDEAQAAHEDAALAHACFVLDWALVESGRPSEAVHSARALEIYERLVQLDRQAAVLNNLGGFAYREGRWDEAVGLYRRGADASMRAGDLANAAYGDCNVGEVLSDQGRLTEARKLLHRARRVWRGTGYDWGVAYATAQLGRIAVREGRHDQGRRELQDALARFRRLRVQGDASWVEALLLEAAAFSGLAVEALEEADRLLLEHGRSVQGGRTRALLLRIRGFALAQLGRPEVADEALEASLAEGRLQDDLYDIAVALDAIDKLSGRTRAALPERTRERDALLERLRVVSLPTPPLAAPPISEDDATRFGRRE